MDKTKEVRKREQKRKTKCKNVNVKSVIPMKIIFQELLKMQQHVKKTRHQK